MDTLATCLEQARIAHENGETLGADAPWNDHPAFTGVRMKHLVTGAETAGRFSCHLVQVAPGCALLSHTHPTQVELHVVLQGDGQCTLCSRAVDYAPGSMAVIPQASEHAVRAGNGGLTILAQFAPALV
ncbi:MAG: cupin domain-containing protein [Desulfovibrionaceae bacterium]|jgi:quercetin dioxygenase-like cupin family protein|nr:cupin domain-containing protein [Desulfovibrionaceae bacterium]